jgi:DNA-binding transcriptional LysR family regulator
MDLRRTDMGLLVALDALLSECSVTRAARKLHISQPALSAQLAKLRRLFDDSLLVGNAHGMIPTPRAVELQEPLHLLLGDLQALVMTQSKFDPATAERTFSITATDYVHATVIRPLISVLREIAPGVRIAALPFNKEAVRDQLKDGTADLCITSEFLTPPDFPARKLLHERFVLILSKSHPSARKRMTLDLFCALDHVLSSPEGGGFRGIVDGVLDSLGRSRKVVGSLTAFCWCQAW